MKKLALTLPGGTQIDNPEGFNQSLNSTGALVGGILNIIFMIAGFLLLIWIIWGVLQYILAGGNKEGLARARARIQWAIMGFIFVILAFFLSGYVKDALQPADIDVQKVSPPPALQTR
jgi:hypothetical protein